MYVLGLKLRVIPNAYVVIEMSYYTLQEGATDLLPELGHAIFVYPILNIRWETVNQGRFLIPYLIT